MNKFKYYFILIITTFSLFSCSKNNDTPEITPPRDFAVQYATDIADIETYLKENYITVVDHPGFVDDQDVTIAKITDAASQPSIYSYLNASTFPKLLSREVKLHDITYKVYYLVLREGEKDIVTGFGGESPSNVDGVFSSYKGNLLDGTVFDFSNNGESQFNLDGLAHDGGFGVITGWSEAFPQFKTGWTSSNSDGTIGYHDFGSGVMFLPSGLAYFDTAKGDIPAYSPLVFSLKLYALKRFDHDKDGIPSYLEDLNEDGYVRSFAAGVTNPDDSDGDGIPDFMDVDDDADGYSTKLEISSGTNYLDKNSHP